MKSMLFSRTRLLFLLVVFCSITEKTLSQDESSVSLGDLLRPGSLQKRGEQDKETRSYRLTIERSFDPMIIIQLSGSGNNYNLSVWETNRTISNYTVRYTKIVESKLRMLSKQEASSFLMLISNCAFWELPGDEWREEGMDGSTWTLEGVDNGKYHKVVRSNPFIPAKHGAKSGILKEMGAERAYSEGLLAASFVYLWSASGKMGEHLY